MQNISETFEQAVKKRDIKAIRRDFIADIPLDQGFTQGIFDEKLRYCHSLGITDNELFVPFEGEPLNENRAAWMQDYLAMAQAQFRSNFSKERLEHLRKVGKHLFPAAARLQTDSGQFSPHRNAPPPAADEAAKKNPEAGFRTQTSGQREKTTDRPLWIIAAGIGAAVILWLLFGRK